MYQVHSALDTIKTESISVVNTTPIVKYFEATWINGHFPPAEWNQFDVLDDRTNNYVESYNGEVNKKLKTKPVLLKFCDFLRDEENKAEIYWLQSDKKPYYMKKQTKAAKRKLESERTLQSMLKDNKLDLDSYIAKYGCLNELEIVEIEEREDENDLEIWTSSVPNEKIVPLKRILLESVEIALSVAHLLKWDSMIVICFLLWRSFVINSLRLMA